MNAIPRLVLLAAALHATTAPAEKPAPPPPAAPATQAPAAEPWAGVKRESAGWTFWIKSVTRAPSLSGRHLSSMLGFGSAEAASAKRAEVLGHATVAPPEGKEYLLVTLGAARGSAPEAFVLKDIHAIDAAGARHDSMVTRRELADADADLVLPIPVPTGVELRTFAIGDLTWPLAAAPAAPR